jgi:phosphoserine phosphatase RsbU/P
VLLVGDGDVRPVGVPGTLLGALDDPSLHDARLVLGADDVLLLYTTGGTESRTPDGLLGIDGLAGVLAGCGGLDGGGVTRCVEQAVVDAPGHEVIDDVALLVLRAIRNRAEQRQRG